ncbi:MAG: ATP-binding cassette domain-containing protein [Gammaproteobacteria bacterium]|nr:ATP-binding cassette domain-containing protein [Gammaproteobacteria bacterium]
MTTQDNTMIKNPSPDKENKNISDDKAAAKKFDESRFISQAISNALRHDKIDELQFDSPYAACIFPLLEALGWHNNARDLVEALPHFVEQLDLVDLRNILISLGFESQSCSKRLKKIKPELYPCLYETKQGDLLVLIDKNKDEYVYYDAVEGEKKTGQLPNLKGTAYFFTDTNPTHGISSKENKSEAWFSRLTKRFNKMVIHLLAMTAIVNIVALLIPLFVMVVYDKVIGSKSIETLPYLLAGVSILIVADLALRLLKSRLLGALAGRIDYLIGVETFRQLLFLPPLFTERSSVASQLSRLKQFDSIRDFFTGSSAAIILELPFVILFIAVIAAIAGWIALIPVIMAAIYALIAFFWIPYLNAKLLRSGQAKTAKQNILMQTLSGRKEIKSIGGESVWWERFREISGEAVYSNYKYFVANGILASFSQSLMTLSGITVVGFGALSVIEGSMTMGALIATMALIWRVLSPIQSIFLAFPKFQQAFKSIKQIDQLMRLGTEKHGQHSGLLLRDFQGGISIDKVSFRYGPNSDPAILGATFKIEPGEMVAIVGNTGSGKSTLIKLIAGMYKPQAGSIMFDKMDIRQLNSMELRRSIAYIPQESKLFHGTIAQNLRLNNALASDDDLTHAAEQAGVLEQILALPDGFDTRIGDNFTERLPPGFLRSISMARAFISPATIFLLDEPGASLDDNADQNFMNQIKLIKGKRSIVMVSHRPSHIRLADKAILLDQGIVQFVGPSDEAVKLLLGSV